MGSRLGRRVVHFLNLPIKLLLPPTPFESIHEFALKTIPSASKIEIRRILESLYGFDVAEVRTLNMEGKKKKRGGYLVAKPDYKKAYITLKEPLSISKDLFPIPWVMENMKQKMEGKKKKGRKTEVEEEGEGATEVGHWLDEEKGRERREVKYSVTQGKRRGRGKPMEEVEAPSFPWSSMRSWRR